MTIVIASRNLHKVEEIRAVLGGALEYQSLRDHPGAPEVLEDSGTFAGNALKKAVSLAAWLSDPACPSCPPQAGETYVLADDSGLEVDALGGEPGVQSARFAASDLGISGNAPDAENNRKLLRLLSGVAADQRKARFRCVVALTPVLSLGGGTTVPRDERLLRERTELFEGSCEGRIGHAGRGTGGFGYDPLFIPEGCAESFAELGEEKKNRISHRAQALGKAARWLATRSMV